MNTFYLFASMLLLCGSYAALWGGACERWAAGLQVAAFALGLPWWRLLFVPRFFVAPFFAIDVLLLVALMVLAVRARRFWPIWVAGFQAAAVIVHCAKTVAPLMVPQGYSILVQFWGYPMILLTAAGAYWHHGRARHGTDLPWRPRHTVAAVRVGTDCAP